VVSLRALLAMVSIIAAVLTVCSLAVAANPSCDQTGRNPVNCTLSSVVETHDGPVVGFQRSLTGSAYDVSTFRGIPFAAAPVGQNRFRAPQPFTDKWSTVRKTVEWSKVCPQGTPSSYGTKTIRPDLASEDCLFLNVYTPSHAIGSTKPVPVMVFIYGGGYFQGDGASWYASDAGGAYALYDGAALASRHGAVIVTMNYRLDALGFFASDELKAEDPDASTGNMGLLDQRAALKWVQTNIAGFGGDANQVTIFGESAGAFSVLWHLVSPQSWPLFHRAIVESGTSWMNWFFQPYDDKHARKFYAEWAEKLNCPATGPKSLPCLRKLPMFDLVDPPANMSVASPLYDRSVKSVSMAYGPAIDGSGVGLTSNPMTLMRAGKFHKVPLIIGANLDEGTLFGPLLAALPPGLKGKPIKTEDQLKIALTWAFGEANVETIFAAYPGRQFRDGILGPLSRVNYAEMSARMLRDAVFDCSNRAVVEAWAAAGVPAFMYKFAWDPLLYRLDKKLAGGVGVTHGFELPFVWRADHILSQLGSALKADPMPMSDLVTCKWANFAATGNPNGNGTIAPGCTDGNAKVNWPQYDAESRQLLELKQKSTTIALQADNQYPHDDFASDKRCNMWAGILTRAEGTPWPTTDLYETLALRIEKMAAVEVVV